MTSVAEGRTLELDPAVVNNPIHTSKVLFQRLLGEKYLGGQVSFDSFEGAGTTFRIQLSPQPVCETAI